MTLTKLLTNCGLKQIGARVKISLIYLKICALVSLKVLLIWSDFLGNELNSALPLSPEIIKKTIGLQREQSFYHNLAKYYILYVRQVSEYVNEYGCKILANHFWWVLESIKVNKYIGAKRVMSCLHIHVFISFSFLSLTLF